MYFGLLFLLEKLTTQISCCPGKSLFCFIPHPICQIYLLFEVALAPQSAIGSPLVWPSRPITTKTSHTDPVINENKSTESTEWDKWLENIHFARV